MIFMGSLTSFSNLFKDITVPHHLLLFTNSTDESDLATLNPVK